MTSSPETAAPPPGSNRLTGMASWTGLQVEHRQIGPGSHRCDRPEMTELAYILSGRSRIRRHADGPLQEGLALPGTSWLTPSGTAEKLLEFDGEVECLILYLPAKLLEDSALRDHDIDPGQAEIAYAGGFADPTLSQIGLALRDLIERPSQPVDRLFADGLRTALAAHLVGNYRADRWQPAERQPTLEPRRLRRVLDYIEARLSEAISLDDLASQACLSPFHFARLFRRATGLAPHQYLTERRIRGAQQLIVGGGTSLAEVALDSGFGSQASFCRAFRKATGVSPTAYRDLHRRRPVLES
ncbi:AraC family transcriptional regulator [Devosia sp. Root413D1]|uniref:helix-turn-helix domain-containing protein n=1 Tax=unclassified Devosia TaxID=196773 RepID=UPI0006F716B5|nr:AraC family transcriptional regulator [Devosia sp. Root413D1]KQW77627.1 AraC family transcriptional regulator [Devosia sp. Root413D1]